MSIQGERNSAALPAKRPFYIYFLFKELAGVQSAWYTRLPQRHGTRKT